ncbi:MAG: family 43 glycosylhydrolase [Nibricoccus sp.]
MKQENPRQFLPPGQLTSSHLLRSLCLALVALALGVAQPSLRAMEGADGMFDPSNIIKVGSTYHVFADGQGIIHRTSTDLVNWTNASTVFGSGSGPSWIQTYVPGFAGYFWAPDIVYMGGKYYCYYSCSLGAKPCAIGVASSTNLTSWTDLGMVVYSDNNTTYGSIDPGICKDASGNFWMVWGSHLTGIWVSQLNPSTGKFLNSTKTNIANFNDAEGAAMIYKNGYYYLFYNRGTCCSGTSSTYYISVARSTSPTGPFTGNRTYLAGSAPAIGPGHFGYLSDGGAEYVTYHYIDSYSNGWPRLGISKIGWNSDGWPNFQPNWIANGTYKVTASSNGLAWDAWGCTGASGQAVAQGTYAGLSCQKWTFTHVGWGSYKLTCSLGGLSVEAVNCSNANGTKIDLYSDWAGSCQRWKIYRASNGTYVFATMNPSGNEAGVIEIPSASNTVGVQLGLYTYNGGSHQKWNVSAP